MQVLYSDGGVAVMVLVVVILLFDFNGNYLDGL